eukprot:3460695-Prymnesium_polylepis.1
MLSRAGYGKEASCVVTVPNAPPYLRAGPPPLPLPRWIEQRSNGRPQAKGTRAFEDVLEGLSVPS